MAKKESTFSNMVVTLFLVTLASSTALGFIYELTKGPINEARALKKNNAIREVVPEFTNQPGEELMSLATDGDSLFFYIARNNDEITGIAVETFTNQGFAGKFRIMVGFTPDGSIYDITVLEHKETPGLGDKIDKKKSLNKTTGLSWSSQFQGKNPAEYTLSVKKDGGDVDAITASTITSRAFCDAVQRAYDGFLKIKPQLIPE
jgi:electron transport complex protein RnfG